MSANPNPTSTPVVSFSSLRQRGAGLVYARHAPTTTELCLITTLALRKAERVWFVHNQGIEDTQAHSPHRYSLHRQLCLSP